jgi:hypothetical protein
MGGEAIGFRPIVLAVVRGIHIGVAGLGGYAIIQIPSVEATTLCE